MTGATDLSSRRFSPAALLWISAALHLFSFAAASSDPSQNITFYRLPAGGRMALCGYYTLTFEMWAGNTSAYLYVTDAACNETTGFPCLPPTTPALQPLACVDRPSCQGQTSQPSSVPLCLVVLNKDMQAQVELNLFVSGSTTTTTNGGGSSSDDSGELSQFDIVLISVGSAAGFVVLAGLTTLVVWLRCCKPPPRPQPLDDFLGPGGGDAGGKAAMMAAMAVPMGPRILPSPQPLMSPAAVYPYPYSPYGVMPYSMMQPGVPYGGVAPPFSPQGGVRSPSAALAPLPLEAYSALSPQPPTSPPPQLVLPPRALPPAQPLQQQQGAQAPAFPPAAPPPQ